MDKQKALKLRPGQKVRFKAQLRGQCIEVTAVRWLPKPWAASSFGQEWRTVTIPLDAHRARGVASLAAKVRIVGADGAEYVCTLLELAETT